MNENIFNNWNELKKDLNYNGKRKFFREKEIYFISVGKNIGYEIYGKIDKFLRPVLVYKKLGKYNFIGIPLTSKPKQGIKSIALFNQIRVFDSKRIEYFSGKIKNEDFEKLKIQLIEFLSFTPLKKERGILTKSEQRKDVEIIPKKDKKFKSSLKISIITVVYNNKDTIKDAIESVLNQTYKNIEYIIVDGASTDGTVDIIKSYGKKIDKFISEKDNGIYDAMNKGIDLATGDIIGILNSDDFYENESVIERVVKEFESKNVDSIYGDLVYVDANDINRIIRYWKSKPFKKGLFKNGWHPAHPTFFVKKEIYEKYGKFDLDFKIAADYEIMLRFLEKYQISTSYIPEIFVKMRVGGESNKSLKNIFKANIECYKAWKKNNLAISSLITIKKPLTKLFQFKGVK